MSALNETEEFEFLHQMEKDAQAGIPPPHPAPVKASMGDVIAGTPLARMAMGAASPLIGAAQLGAHVGDIANKAMGVEPVVSPWIDKKLAEYDAAKQRGMKASGTKGFDVMGLLGQFYPSAAIGSGVSKALPAATSLLGKMGIGAMQGGTIGATTPVTNVDQGFWSPKGVQTAIGAAIGGVVPAVVEGGRYVAKAAKQLAQPFTESGRAAILKELRDALVGQDPAAKQKMIAALQNPQTLVPGSAPTAGEAMADIPESTGLAAHQQAVSKLPGISPAFQQRTAEQAAAREGAIGQIAQTPEALAAAVKARGEEASQKYGAAFKETIPPEDLLYHGSNKAGAQAIARQGAIGGQPTYLTAIKSEAEHFAKDRGGKVFAVNKADVPQELHSRGNWWEVPAENKIPIASGLSSLLERPSMQKALARAKDLAQERGETFDPTSVKSLHDMKMAMDDLLKNPERFSIGATEAGVIGKTKQALVKWIGEQAPPYEEARQAFQMASQPINRMQVGQELQKALTTPLGTSERSGVFAKAVEDAPRTIKKATGQAMFDKLDEVLQPEQATAVRQVADELARKDAFQRLARATKLSGSDAIPGTPGLPIPNLLSRPAMLANFALKHFGKSAEEKIAKVAAQQYLNPPELAKALQDVPVRYRPMIEAVLRQAAPAAATGAVRASEGMQP